MISLLIGWPGVTMALTGSGEIRHETIQFATIG
jgi:hypothetical protein